MKKSGFVRMLLLGVVLLSCACWSQTAQVTTWTMPHTDSLPSDLVVMGDGRVYVALFDPQSIGLLDPSDHSFREWSVDEAPEGVVVTDRGVFFTLPRAGAIGVLQPDVSVTTGWLVPSSAGWPKVLEDAVYGAGAVNLWFTERTASRLGLYAPSMITLPAYLGPEPTPVTLSHRTVELDAFASVVGPGTYPGNPMLPPPIYLMPPTVSGDFREWASVAPEAYVEDLALAPDGRVWFSQGAVPLTVLDPATDTMLAYGLPTGTNAVPVAAAPTGEVWFGDTARPAIGRLDPATGDVTMWTIPGGRQPFDLAVDTRGEVWFTDREANAVYLLRPTINEFVWWDLAPDTHPIYLDLEADGTVWFSEERGNAISRLVIAGAVGAPPAEAPIAAPCFEITGFAITQTGNFAQAELRFHYGGAIGLPIWICAQVLSHGSPLAQIVALPVEVGSTGPGEVALEIRYTGTVSATSDTIRFTVALGPLADALVAKDVPMDLQWIP